jgi:hypothetical protein
MVATFCNVIGHLFSSNSRAAAAPAPAPPPPPSNNDSNGNDKKSKPVVYCNPDISPKRWYIRL